VKDVMRLSSLEVYSVKMRYAGGVMRQTDYTACRTCKCKLFLNYVRYRDTEGYPYCHICYTRLMNDQF